VSALGTVVVKLGGEVVGAPAVLGPIAGDIAELARGGARVVVVHGGGPQATALQEKLGQTPRKIAGRRVTDEATLDVVKMVVAG
jgi:acetylglutamate kinase